MSFSEPQITYPTPDVEVSISLPSVNGATDVSAPDVPISQQIPDDPSPPTTDPDVNGSDDEAVIQTDSDPVDQDSDSNGD